MSVGSPALAAYSLVITSRNIRMVTKRAMLTKHEAGLDVAKVLFALQQQPYELTEDQVILSTIRQDKKLRDWILDRLGKKNGWSLTTVFTVTWVVIAFCFTLASSFVSSSGFSSSGSDGLAVGILWFWLLCLVVGWLRVPVYSSSEINNTIRCLNEKVVKYANEKLIRPAREVEKLEESGTPPPAPADRQGVSETQNEDRNSTNVGPPARVHPEPDTASLSWEKHRLIILVPSTGWLSDEARPPPTFNYSRIMRYHMFIDAVFQRLDKAVSDLDKAASDQEENLKVGVSGKCQMTEIVLPIFNRNRGLTPGTQPLLSRARNRGPTPGTQSLLSRARNRGLTPGSQSLPSRNRSLTPRRVPMIHLNKCFLQGQNGR